MKSLYSSQKLYVGNTLWQSIQQGIRNAPLILYAIVKRYIVGMFAFGPATTTVPTMPPTFAPPKNPNAL